jgi:hypothetical protein
MSALDNYLEKISEGKPINFNKFLDALPLQYSRRKHEFLSAELVASNLWQVKFLDDAIFAELRLLAEKPTSRLHAADQGNSHQISTTAGYLLVYHDLLPDQRPDIVYLDKELCVQGFASKRQLLLIENEENFFQFERMCHAVSRTMGIDIKLSNTDIALGSGMKVAAHLQVQWYKKYERVLCAFDYDLAGLEMFASLKDQLNERAVFVQPVNYAAWLESFKKTPDSANKLQKARELAMVLGFSELCQAFTDTRKFMEQELMLKVAPDE